MIGWVMKKELKRCEEERSVFSLRLLSANCLMVLKITTKTLARDRKYRIRDWTLTLKFRYISSEERSLKKKGINWHLTRLREEDVTFPITCRSIVGLCFLTAEETKWEFSLSVGFWLTLEGLSPKSNGYWKLSLPGVKSAKSSSWRLKTVYCRI